MRRIGIDLGGTKIEGVLLDDAHRPLHRHRIATESERGYDHIVERVAAVAAPLLAQAPECETIGIGTPGAISSRTGRLKNSNTVCLNGRDLHGDLCRRLGRAVTLENDANCFALAEAVAGAGEDANLVFGVIMGTGVGGGIVHGRRLHRGPQHIAGEWGHHSIDPAGPDCYCGHRGCVETYLSGPALERAYTERTSTLLDAAAIVAHARRGEVDAAAVMATFLDRFGRALGNLISILDPDLIVLGGGLSNIEELYTDGRAAVAHYVCNDELRTPIVRNRLGDSAGVIGAALL